MWEVVVLEIGVWVGGWVVGWELVDEVSCPNMGRLSGVGGF